MKQGTTRLKTTALACLFALASGNAHAVLIDLGFLLDRSGSVSFGNYELMTDALADSLGLIPTSGPAEYRVAVVSFASDVRTVVQPTILTDGNLLGVQDQITADGYNGGWTNTAAAIDWIAHLYDEAGGLGDTSLLNISTDGNPLGPANTPLDTETLAAGAAAIAAGWDGISAEAIGSSIDFGFLSQLVSPQPAFVTFDSASLPDPAVQGFVLRVSDFSQYPAAIEAKVRNIVDPPVTNVPEPTTLSLLGIGLIGFGLSWRGRQRRETRAQCQC